jgi:hypothetical protein
VTKCPHCGRDYDPRFFDDPPRHPEAYDYDDYGWCMACIGLQVQIAGGRLEDLPTHEVIEEGMCGPGFRYVRVRYWDGSEDVIDPVYWDEDPQGTYGKRSTS